MALDKAQLEAMMHKVLDERGNGMKSETLELGYGKWWARIKGEHLLAAALVLAAVGFVGYLLYQHDVDQRTVSARIERELHESNEIQQALLWVNSLSDAERSKLNLTRPKKITEMQR